MNEEMRKEFEEWCKGRWFINIEFSNGKYISQQTQMKWELWQASREAMKPIKLPDATFETPSGDNALREDVVIDAIYAAGYKVVPW